MRIVTLPDRGAPTIDLTAWCAPTATLIGTVTVEAEASIWYDCVLRGDRDQITIGPGVNIQDRTVLHTDPGFHLRLERDASVGHGCILHGCIIEEGALIGMGATIMNGAVIGAGSIVGAGAVVGAGTVVPPRSMVLGLPAKVRRELSDEEAAHGRLTAEHYRELRLEHWGAGVRDVEPGPRPN